jgi:hypothetical protein
MSQKEILSTNHNYFYYFIFCTTVYGAQSLVHFWQVL